MRAPALLLALIAATAPGWTVRANPQPESRMVRVGPGTYRPLYPPSPAETEIPVRAFWLDRLPATNGEFVEFVRAHPEWRRDRVSAVFADEDYLSHWATPDALGLDVDNQQPVVRVSWFAAKAYCAARGDRLPTEAEWELAASASRTQRDGSLDPAWREQIAAWYSRPNPRRLPVVGTTPANYWGVHDLLGLVWEWVLDFNGAMLMTDTRQTGDKNAVTFCGGGAANATDKSNYPAFMRVAFRSSLRADYTTKNLGFRCAADDKEGKP